MWLKEWAFLGNDTFYTRKLRTLAEELEPEKWSYAGKDDFGILKSYIDFTFQKLLRERNDAGEDSKNCYVYMDDTIAIFNTGLYDKYWQTEFFYCEKNPIPEHQEWRFKCFFNDYTAQNIPVSGTVVSSLRRASFFDDPGMLIFDINREIKPQWKHILDDEENFLRIPRQIRDNGKSACQNAIRGELDRLKKRANANYKTVVPQWYKGQLQLLAPLYLTNDQEPDLALVLSMDKDKTVYYGNTCLTIEMAYNNARLIARPDSYWLQP